MMNRKEVILNLLRGEKVEKVPWVPFVGVHGGTLIGCDATEVLQNEDKLFAAIMKANQLYKPFGQPIVFDLQIEAEIFGCELRWAKDSPPSVMTHPLSQSEEIVIPCRCMMPSPTDGRIPMILNVMKRVKQQIGDTTALYGLICGPFTLAAHLRGNDIFMDMYDDEEKVKALLDYCKDVAKKMATYYIEAGMDVIAVVDPLISQISTSHFAEFMAKPFTELFDHIRNSQSLSSFFVCGDATRNIEGMCQTHPDSISVDENVDIIKAKKITDQYHIVIGGNIPLTTVMLHGTQQDNMKYVIDLLDRMDNKEHFILAPGCDMPYATPIENVIGASEAVLETEKVREVIKNYTASDDSIEVELPDYQHLDKPLIEVFTLDSATCAACTYMLLAATEIKEKFGDLVEMVEYKYTVKENIARIKKMKVKNLPSIYINGQLVFQSLVPSKEEFEDKIKELL